MFRDRPDDLGLPRAWILAVVLVLAAVTTAAQLAVPPPPTRRVNDYASTLSPAERERLEQKLAERERGSPNQVVVAVFRSLEGAQLEDYSIRLAQAWRVGQKGLDNGVIFLVFLDDRRVRLEVGYGLEATLTDAQAASIIRDVVAPRFREGRLAEGVEAGLDAIDRAIAGTYAPVADGVRRDPGVGLPLLLAVAILLVFLAVAASGGTPTVRRRRGYTIGPGTFRVPPPIYFPPPRSGWPGRDASPGGFSGGGGRFGGGGASGSW